MRRRQAIFRRPSCRAGRWRSRQWVREDPRVPAGQRGRVTPTGPVRPPRRPLPRWISPIPRSRLITTPASAAGAAYAPAARSRATMSSAMPGAATRPASSSTWTTRWAPPPAWAAASASRPVPPVRCCRAIRAPASRCARPRRSRSVPCAPSVASAARQCSTSATTGSCASRGPTARPTRDGCASRAASAWITRPVSSGSRCRWCAVPMRPSATTSAACPTIGAMHFGRRAGRRRWRWPPAVWRVSATRTVPGRWPASARPRAATKRPISSRNWCVPDSAATTSTTARGSATRRRWPRCSRALARARSQTRWPTSSIRS